MAATTMATSYEPIRSFPGALSYNDEDTTDHEYDYRPSADYDLDSLLDDDHHRDGYTDYSGYMASIRVLALGPNVSKPHHRQVESWTRRGPNGHTRTTTRFQNPWPSWRGLSWTDAYDSFMQGTQLKSAPEAGQPEQFEANGRMVEVVKPQWEVPAIGDAIADDRASLTTAVTAANKPTSQAKVCWLGHAGVFVQLPWPHTDESSGVKANKGVGVIFDPFFSKR